MESQRLATRLQPRPLPDNIVGTQPGGGFGYRSELAWASCRRWLLRTLRPGYVRRMAGLRRGSTAGCPHEILDPRDLKYCRNRCDCWWDAADDPFRWRERIPLARWGWIELNLFGWPLVALVLALGWIHPLAALPPLVILAWLFWFFRDPPRKVPQEPGAMVSPADGKVAEVTELEHDEFVGGPAVRIGIFLSIFNVHINRSPLSARVIGLKYTRGEFLNALKPASALENEAMWIGLEEEAPPHRRLVVRQIAGAIARRIVCDPRPGEVLPRGHRFGMIKFGSRTELVLPLEDGLVIETAVGQRVRGGASVLARYQSTVEIASEA